MSARPESAFTRMNKPREIEEFLDTWLIRPMGYVLVLALQRTPVTPNMVSAASVVAAVGVAAALLPRTLPAAALALLFMLLTSALDSADGQLARATGRKSEIGRFVDGFCDNLSFGSIYVAIVVGGGAALPGSTVTVAVLALLAALSHSAQSSLTDYQRQLFLAYCLDGRGLEDESPERLDARLARARDGGSGPVLRLFLRLHRNYCRQQRLLLPGSDRLHRAWLAAIARDLALRPRFAARYRAVNESLVRWWAVGGPNAHKVGIVGVAFVAALVHTGAIGRLGMVLYLFYDLALNVPTLAMMRVQARADAALLHELERGEV